VLEHGLPSEEADETETAALHRLDPEEFPTLSQLEDFEHVMWLDDEQFRVGLRLLVEGIRHRYGI
jgi:hypothetical protein